MDYAMARPGGGCVDRARRQPLHRTTISTTKLYDWPLSKKRLLRPGSLPSKPDISEEQRQDQPREEATRKSAKTTQRQRYLLRTIYIVDAGIG
jgi:hypothetical protein